MSTSFFGLLQILPALVTLGAQWVGVIAMRDARHGAWWVMMIGTAMSTLGGMLSIASMLMMFRSSSSIVMISSVVGFHTLGGLVFASGFAIHGLRRKAAREREQQLEAITSAMSEELRVARERGR